MNKKAYQSPHTEIIGECLIYVEAGTVGEDTSNASIVNNVELDSNSSSFDDEPPSVSSNVWE